MQGKLPFIVLFLFVAMLLMGLEAHAQPGDPDNPDGVPIDGGISFLVAAALGLGVHALRKRTK